MKNILNGLKNMETSKKLLLIVTLIWLTCTVINYVLGIKGIDSNMISTTYGLINTAFMFELANYGLKSGAENIVKINNSKQTEVQSLLNKATTVLDSITDKK